MRELLAEPISYSFLSIKRAAPQQSIALLADKAAEIARWQKSITDPINQNEIVRVLDLYVRKLAENMNSCFAIEARVPSVMIAGLANFTVRRKEKQNLTLDRNRKE